MFKIDFLKTRSIDREAMDNFSITGDCFESSFRFMRLVNNWFGGTRTTLKGIETLLLNWDKTQPIHLLEIGCGCGDTIIDIHRWGQVHGYQFQFTAIDIRADFLEMTRRRTQGLEVNCIMKDMLENALPKADIVHCAMTLHHLNDQQITVALKHLKAAARCGLVVNDLKRCFATYLGCWFLTRLFADPICRNDALESVRSGFTVDELNKILTRNKITAIIQPSWWFRLRIIVQCDS